MASRELTHHVTILGYYRARGNWKMERQKSTLHAAANVSHSFMNGHCGSGVKRPRMDIEGSVKKKKKGEFLKGSIVRIRLHNFL